MIAAISSKQAVGKLLRVGGDHEILHHAVPLYAAVEVSVEHLAREDGDQLCGR